MMDTDHGMSRSVDDRCAAVRAELVRRVRLRTLAASSQDSRRFAQAEGLREALDVFDGLFPPPDGGPPTRCLACDGAKVDCGFCALGVPLDSAADWQRTWGALVERTGSAASEPAAGPAGEGDGFRWSTMTVGDYHRPPRRTHQHQVMARTAAWVERTPATEVAAALVNARSLAKVLRRKRDAHLRSITALVASRDEARVEIDRLRRLVDDSSQTPVGDDAGTSTLPGQDDGPGHGRR
jgi:hypothetical protein